MVSAKPDEGSNQCATDIVNIHKLDSTNIHGEC